MKFICDVHISFKIVNHLNLLGYETVHVNAVLNKWYTRDSDISAFADLHDLIVITKDSDLKNSFAITQTPRKLIKINLGNILNQDLITDLMQNMKRLCEHLGGICAVGRSNLLIWGSLRPTRFPSLVLAMTSNF